MVYILVKLIQGDCLEVMKSMEDNSIDCIIVDPPYKTTDCAWDKQHLPWKELYTEIWRVLTAGGSLVMHCQPPFTFMIGSLFIKEYRHRWVWEKDKSANFQAVKFQPHKISEDILIFSRAGFVKPWNNNGKPKSTYNPQMLKGKGASREKTLGVKRKKGKFIHEICSRKSENSNLMLGINDSSKQRYPKDVIYYAVPHKDRVHVTQKPVKLLEHLIRTYTNEGETILDFTMGSGSTGVAAKNTNRSFIGIELDKEYFKIAEERING